MTRLAMSSRCLCKWPRQRSYPLVVDLSFDELRMSDVLGIGDKLRMTDKLGMKPPSGSLNPPMNRGSESAARTGQGTL